MLALTRTKSSNRRYCFELTDYPTFPGLTSDLTLHLTFHLALLSPLVFHSVLTFDLHIFMHFCSFLSFSSVGLWAGVLLLCLPFTHALMLLLCRF